MRNRIPGFQGNSSGFNESLAQSRRLALALPRVGRAAPRFAPGRFPIGFALVPTQQSLMPILAPEPACFPDNLLTDAPKDLGRKWSVVYTKSKMEKALARHLHARSVPYYLPLEFQSWRKNGRSFSSYLAFFPGYLFLLANPDDRITALESNTISRILDVSDQDQLILDMRRVYRMLTAEVPVEHAVGFVPGQAVEIVAGPLRGLLGTLIRKGSQLRLVVEVQFLRQAVSAEVEPWMIEPVGTAPSLKIGASS